MTGNWNGKDLRRRLASRADRLERYFLEHRDRIRRGQSNGSRMMHDQTLGEWWVVYRFTGRSCTDKREALRDELVELQKEQPSFSGAYDKDAARVGFEMAIRSLLAEIDDKGIEA